MSFAPKDEHQAQVQMALERGIPAVSAVMGTQRLVYPSNVFDVVHCARCRVPWDADGTLSCAQWSHLMSMLSFFVARPIKNRWIFPGFLLRVQWLSSCYFRFIPSVTESMLFGCINRWLAASWVKQDIATRRLICVVSNSSVSRWWNQSEIVERCTSCASFSISVKIERFRVDVWTFLYHICTKTSYVRSFCLLWCWFLWGLSHTWGIKTCWTVQ